MVLALLSLLILAAAIPDRAATAPPGPWVSPARPISPITGNSAQSRIEAGPEGTVAAYWLNKSAADWILQVRVRPPGEPFGPIEDLSASGFDASSPVLDIGPDGSITAVWSSSDGANLILKSRNRSPDGGWGPTEDLTPGLPSVGPPAVAIGPDGTTTATWSASNGTHSIVRARTRPPGGDFGPEVLLSEPGEHAGFPQVGNGPEGKTTIVWTRNNGPADMIQSSTRPAGGSFGPVQDLGSGATTPKFQLDIWADGTLGVVWLRQDGIYRVVRVRTRPPSGGFDPAVDLSITGQSADNPQLAIGPDGTATAVWTRSNGADDIVQTRSRSPEGQLGLITDLSLPGEFAFNPEVAFGPDGTEIAVWARAQPPVILIQSSSRVPGGTFGGSQNLSGTGQSGQIPHIAVGPDGMVTVNWTRVTPTSLVYSISTLPPRFTLATFVPQGPRGTVTSDPPGIACGSDCLAEFTSSTKVTLTATPNAGNQFTGWDGACSGTESICELTMDQASSVSAGFEAAFPPCPPKTLKTDKLKRNRKKGIAKLKVTAGGEGKVILKGSKKVRKFKRDIGENGKGKIRVKARGRAARKLKRRGRVKVRVKLVYRPGGGCPSRKKTKKIKLVRKR